MPSKFRLWAAIVAVPMLFDTAPAQAQERPGTPVSPAASKPTAACASGLMPRLAGPTDLVCVSPLARGRTVRENAEAARHVDPHGAYGPNSCRWGYVWREAFVGDVVCVMPRTRKTVASENYAAAKHLKASEQVPVTPLAPKPTPPVASGRSAASEPELRRSGVLVP